MAFTLENIRNTYKEARANLIEEGYEVIKRRVSYAAKDGRNEVNIQVHTLTANGYIINDEHIEWLIKLGFEVHRNQDALSCSSIKIKWKD